jgi:hypothetical protein
LDLSCCDGWRGGWHWKRFQIDTFRVRFLMRSVEKEKKEGLT